jgi:hypothetical protein
MAIDNMTARKKLPARSVVSEKSEPNPAQRDQEARKLDHRVQLLHPQA